MQAVAVAVHDCEALRLALGYPLRLEPEDRGHLDRRVAVLLVDLGEDRSDAPTRRSPLTGGSTRPVDDGSHAAAGSGDRGACHHAPNRRLSGGSGGDAASQVRSRSRSRILLIRSGSSAWSRACSSSMVCLIRSGISTTELGPDQPGVTLQHPGTTCEHVRTGEVGGDDSFGLITNPIRVLPKRTRRAKYGLAWLPVRQSCSSF